MIEERTSCPVIPAASVNVSWDYNAVRVSFGSQQEMFSAFDGKPQGLQPNWLITANLSPQTALQLHAILGESLRQYEESIGLLPRLDVMFEKTGSGVPISSGGGQVVALKLVPKAEPEETKAPETTADFPVYDARLDQSANAQQTIQNGIEAPTACERCGRSTGHSLWCDAKWR